jgi:lysophospholipase L1-like esterase
MSSQVLNSLPHTALLTVQVFLASAALVLAFLPGLPWFTLVTLGFVVCGGLTASLHARHQKGLEAIAQRRASNRIKGWVWGATLGYCAGAAWTQDTVEFWNAYFAVIAWLVAGSFAAGYGSRQAPLELDWMKSMAWVWAMIGALLWLGAAYLQNRIIPFYLGLALLFGLFLGWRFAFKLSALEIQVANSALLILVLFPLTDWFMHASPSRPAPRPAERPYSFTVAQQDPTRFAAWWNHYQEAWNLMARDLFMPDPRGELPLRLRPNSQGHLIESPIRINHHGFRGNELTQDIHNVYRMVALGESTTFGCTLETQDRPWPELLEDLIRERLHPTRPVEVINAGVPAYSLAGNLTRLEREFLPLQPDLIISYHGYNGFPLLRTAVPQTPGTSPPTLPRRPSPLLAKIEFRLLSIRYQQTTPARPQITTTPVQTLLESDYANRYRELIEWTTSRGIQLALCTFSMAVDRQSSQQVIEFYQPGFPAVRWQIAANEAHNNLVRQLAKDHPEVWLIETTPHLDGQHEHYIDLVHLTQPGRQQLAESIFNGLSQHLATRLVDP